MLVRFYLELLFCFFVFLVISGFLSLRDHQVHREDGAHFFVAMTFAAALITGFAWVSSYHLIWLQETLQANSVIYFLISIFNVCYLFSLRRFLSIHSKSLQVLTWATVLIFVICTANLLASLIFQPFLFELIARNVNKTDLLNFYRGTPNSYGLTLAFFAITVKFLVFFCFCQQMWKHRIYEPLILAGIFLNAVFILHDLTIYNFIVPTTAYSLLAFGGLPEVLRIRLYYQRLNRKKWQGLQDQVSETSKRAAAAFMTGGIVHDIRNPLSVMTIDIYLLTSWYENQIEKAPNIGACLNRLRKSSETMITIINSYLALLRGTEVQDAESIPVSKLIHEAVELMTPQLRERNLQNLKMDVDSNLRVHGNFVQLQLVLGNLIRNSMDAISQKENPWISISARAHLQRVHLRISDCGDLSPDQVEALLLHPTSNKGDKGNGIGLQISANLIQRHGGHLCGDTLAKNTCFLIDLPAFANA